MIGTILYQIFPLVVAMTISPGLPTLVAAAIAGRLVTFVMLYVFCLQKIPARALPRLEFSEIRPLLGFGGWITLTNFITSMMTVFDRFVIGTITNMAAVAAYTISYNFVLRIGALPSSYENALYPRFPMLDSKEAHALHGRAVRVVTCVMTPVLVIALVLIKPFLTLWIGNDLANKSAPIGLILLVGMWFFTMSFIPVAYFQSRGRPVLPAILRVFELIFYVPALFFFTEHFGVMGAAWIWDARAFLDVVLLFVSLRMLPNLISAWPEILLLCVTYVFETAGFLPALTSYSIGAVLVAASIFRAIRGLPVDILVIVLARIKTVRFSKTPVLPL